MPQINAQGPKTQSPDGDGIECYAIEVTDEIEHNCLSFLAVENMGCISHWLRNWYPIAA